MKKSKVIEMVIEELCRTKVSKLSYLKWQICFNFFLDNDEVYDFNEILLCYVAQKEK
jgi:hypothetical protein